MMSNENQRVKGVSEIHSLELGKARKQLYSPFGYVNQLYRLHFLVSDPSFTGHKGNILTNSFEHNQEGAK